MARWSFTEHPATVGESYWEHQRFATGVGLKMILGGLACMIHGLVPFLFVTTGSRTIKALHARCTSGARGGAPRAAVAPSAGAGQIAA